MCHARPDTIPNGPRSSILRNRSLFQITHVSATPPSSATIAQLQTRSLVLLALRIRYVIGFGIPGPSKRTPCDRQRCSRHNENKERDDEHFACNPFPPQPSSSQCPLAGRSAETWNDLPGALHTVYMIPDTLGFPSRHKQADFEGNTFTEPVVLRALHRGWEDCPGGRGDRGSLGQKRQPGSD